MNKTAIKNFAIWARTKLIGEITYRAGLIGVSENGIAEPLPQSTSDLQFFDIGTKQYAEVSNGEIKQRNALIRAIKDKENDSDYKTAFETIIEEIAYTWFNRMIAIRFMEVNDYLPSGVRVLSSENPAKNEPDFVTNPFETDLEFKDGEQEMIMQLKDDNKLDELFRMLFIKQCNKLNEILPDLFERTNDYTELLLTISFTDKDGVVYRLVHDIAEDDFNVEKEGQVEIIGWLYQYWNTEPKDKVFADLKKNIKITKEKIPAATQLFTPDWIVRYMVENSLGRLYYERKLCWLQDSPDLHRLENLKANWKYYLDEAEQEPDVREQLDKIRSEENLNIEEIKFIDPCMGSGHILVYAFDVLMQIYESNGYTERDAAASIVSNNLCGLDIDRRAAQLAYFAVMMKARQYDRRFFARGIQPNLYVIRESNHIDHDCVDYIANGDEKIKADMETLMGEMHNATQYGSIITVSPVDFEAIYNRFNEIFDDVNMYKQQALDEVLPLVRVAQVLAQKYDVVCTNPPYMGSSGMNTDFLGKYVKDNYPDSKSDLFAVFIEKGNRTVKQNGYNCMVTMQSWMFLSSFEKMRDNVLKTTSITNLMHMENMVMGIAFGTAVTVFRKGLIKEYRGTYNQIKFQDIENDIPKEFPVKGNRFAQVSTDNFSKIPGSPIAYWVSERVINLFNENKKLVDYGQPRQGVKTLDNNRFLKLWYEVNFSNISFTSRNQKEASISNRKWFPYNKGGEFRKWYGNNEYVVNWYNDGEEMKRYAIKCYGCVTRTITNIKYFYKECLTWSSLTSGNISLRYAPCGFIFDSKGSSMFFEDDSAYYILGLVNSKTTTKFLQVLAPTMDFNIGPLQKVPTIYAKDYKEQIDKIVKYNISISKQDWDSFETSWDFKRHPLVALTDDEIKQYQHLYWSLYDCECSNSSRPLLSGIWEAWDRICKERFNKLKENEEELNRIFIDIYGLQDELTPEIEDKDVTVRLANPKRDIQSLISYAVGCMFGRYSLDIEGLAYAGGEWDNGKYATFIPDEDNCIPITDEEYFGDDIVGRFIEFIKIVFGEENLERNLYFISWALGGKGGSSPRDVIRNYFLKDFFKDHCKIYQKRPIYWLFDSGKQNGFKALVYMHRWNADTVGNVRVEYLHRLQRVYEKEMERMQDTIDNSNDNKEIAAAEKRRDKLQKQLKETKDYDASMAHIALARIDIDLDDGVKVNYEKVQTAPDGKKMQILAKI